jgi:hypothetical protein
MKPKTKNSISVILGCIVMVVTGWVLFPLLKIAIINTYTVSKQQGIPTDAIQLSVINLLWVSISAVMGGYAACRFAATKKIFQSLLSGFSAGVILLLVDLYMQRFYWTDIIIMLMIIAFAIIGGIVAELINNKATD